MKDSQTFAFGSDYHVKLIDLDQAISIKHGSVEGYIGEMYKVPNQWSPSQCDWKQLGLPVPETIFESCDQPISLTFLSGTCFLDSCCFSRTLLSNSSRNEVKAMEYNLIVICS